MDQRTQNLLHYIIQAHIKTSQAIGSNLIAQKYMKDVSGPTVRNMMQELEKDGYITHLHTSAGRVPTQKGYEYYLENIKEKDISSKHQTLLQQAESLHNTEQEKVKSIAKMLAELSDNAVVIAFSRNDVYYTGLSNLFSHPEFGDQDVVVNMSQVIDHLDEVMSNIEIKIDGDIKILVGTNNPFGAECASILSITKTGMVFGILGPMRMDYEKNIALIKYIKRLYEN